MVLRFEVARSLRMLIENFTRLQSLRNSNSAGAP